MLLHGLLLSLQFGVPGLDLGSGGPISVSLGPDATPVAPPVPLAPEPLASVPLTATPRAPVPEPVPAPAPVPLLPPEVAKVTGLRLVDLPPPPPAIEPAKPAPARARPKRAKQPSVKRRVREAVPPVIVAAPNPESDFTVPLPDVVPEPAPLLAQEVEEIIEPPQLAQSAAEETSTDAPDDAEELARIAAEEERRRALEQEQERERIARQQADDEARRTAQLEERERLARQQLEQQRQLADEQALGARQEEERRAQEAALAARANDELLRQREAQEQAARQLADQRAAEQAALQAQAIAQQRAQDEARRLDQAREQAETQRLEAQRLAQEQAERRRIQEQNRMAQERARQQAEAQARADAERLARQQADEAARRSAADRLQAQGPGPGQGSGQPDGLGSGVGAPGSGSGTGERSQPGAIAGMPGSRARELLRGLTIPGAGVPAPVAGQNDARRVVATGGERDAPLRLYVDSVRQKLERNAVLGGARLALRDVRIDPLVSLALRSDGSIDDVTIVRSSGQPDMDEAVRRFVRLNARYSAFPPNVAARFDVIEIRRIWRFTDGLKLLEEMR